MKEYYQEALDAAAEAYGEFYEALDLSSDKLEHFLNLAKLTRKEFDFKYFDKILNAQLDTSLISANSKKLELEQFQSEYYAIKKEYERVKNNPFWSEEDLKMKEEKLKASEQKMLEAQNAWLEELEGVAELAKEIYENTLEDIK